jgi:hypothetical protein
MQSVYVTTNIVSDILTHGKVNPVLECHGNSSMLVRLAYPCHQCLLHCTTNVVTWLRFSPVARWTWYLIQPYVTMFDGDWLAENKCGWKKIFARITVCTCGFLLFKAITTKGNNTYNYHISTVYLTLADLLLPLI